MILNFLVIEGLVTSLQKYKEDKKYTPIDEVQLTSLFDINLQNQISRTRIFFEKNGIKL